MPDKVFFPLAALLAGLLIFLALDPFSERIPYGPMSAAGVNVHDMTVEGINLHRFTFGKKGELKVKKDDGVESLLITLKSEEDYDYPLMGTYLPLDADVEYALQGRRVRITVTARWTGQFPASQFLANYSVGSRGESGWIKFDLTPEFQDHSFEYEVPYSNRGLGMDFLAIKPVVPNKERTVEIQKIHFRSLTEPRPRE